MERRFVATLLVVGGFGVARAGQATELPPPAEVALSSLSPPPPPALVFEPLPPARAPGGAGPLVAGALTAFAPFVVGCSLWSQGERGNFGKAGATVMAAGFAAAPWVSHGLQHRWRRAAVFGSMSVATSAATLIAMEAKDPFYAPYANRQRVAFGVLFTSAMFVSAIGVIDSFLIAPAPETP